MDKETIEQLNEELSEDEIKSRSTDWGTVEYLSASNVINKANKIFDYEWNGEIINLELVRKEQITRTYTKNGKKVKKEMWDVSYTCVYQVSVGDRTHQDVGFGNSMQENLSSSLETAIKSAVSDGIKRALRAWGDQ
ncbi:MAG: RAD52 family DNA repair protein, partial [Clostridiales bacterium]|nr:RAD52 family DNA repair protein [Clostridiales bacterium]